LLLSAALLSPSNASKPLPASIPLTRATNKAGALSVKGTPSNQHPTPQHIDVPHLLAASYYSLNEGLSATLMRGSVAKVWWCFYQP
jgi:hypothetical protein